jgi:hypothetical protein
MNLLHDNDRSDLEDGVRTMLHRLAADATERPPAWEDLVEGDRAVVVPIGVSESITEIRDRRPGRSRRPVVSLAAAAVVLLGVAGVTLVDRPGPAADEAPAAATISAISPGDPAFDAGAAAAFWATGTGEPVAAAQAYIEATGVQVDAAAPPALVLRTATEATAVVDWSVPDAPDAGGTVYLRSASVPGGPPVWAVVGASAPGVALAEVQYDGDDLSFTVARTSAEAEQVAVSVWVDGHPVSLGGEAVARAGAADVSLGELVDIGAAVDAHDTLALPVDADDVVTLRVVHVLDGLVRSVTQMAVALPDAEPEVAVAAEAPAVDAGAEATGQADVGPDGASATAEAEVDAEAGDGSGGVELVPGVTLPTLPELPPLPPVPTIPPVPGVPLPTLPTPPTTAPGSLPDLLP